jgi:hypothetical protein
MNDYQRREEFLKKYNLIGEEVSDELFDLIQTRVREVRKEMADDIRTTLKDYSNE